MTPQDEAERLAENYAIARAVVFSWPSDMAVYARDAFLEGYRCRDAEVARLREALRLAIQGDGTSWSAIPQTNETLRKCRQALAASATGDEGDK